MIDRSKRRAEAFLMLTHTAEPMAPPAGKPVATKAAQEIQADLFVQPQEDGLFPGHSQTWKRTAAGVACPAVPRRIPFRANLSTPSRYALFRCQAF